MLIYIVRRLLIACITLLLITFIIYGLIRNIPGDPLTMELMDPSIEFNEEDLQRMRAAYGLDQPWYIAYFEWLGKLFTGNLGESLTYKTPVTRIIAERIPATLVLSISSLSIAYLLAIPMGLYATVRRNKTEERVLSVTLYMLYSVPTFVAAVFLQSIVAVQLDLLPLFGMSSTGYDQMTPSQQAWDVFSHAVLPVTVMTYTSLAYYSRFVRSNMLEVIQQDYIRTARAKGVHPLWIILHHAFRNTLIPLVTLIGLTMPALLSGSVIIEQIFNWQGIGWLYFKSITQRDYPVLMGLMLMFSILTLLGQLLADVLYAMVDPRINLS